MESGVSVPHASSVCQLRHAYLGCVGTVDVTDVTGRLFYTERGFHTSMGVNPFSSLLLTARAFVSGAVAYVCPEVAGRDAAAVARDVTRPGGSPAGTRPLLRRVAAAVGGRNLVGVGW
jgi:hypothetical protein